MTDLELFQQALYGGFLRDLVPVVHPFWVAGWPIIYGKVLSETEGWVPVASTFENLSRINPHITAIYFRPPLIIMTSEQFNPEHYIQSLVSSFSVSADYKITTSLDSRKVKYDKTNPFSALNGG